MKIPTLKDKVVVYELLMHLIQLNREVVMNSAKVVELLDLIGNWSYAHRCGNGEIDNDQRVREVFWKMADKVGYEKGS